MTEKTPEETMRKAISALAALALLAGQAFSCARAATLDPIAPEEEGMSSERLGRIATIFNQEVAAGRIPGAVVMVARGGHIVYRGAFGYADKETGRKMTMDAIFRLYSMTKPMVSVAAMTLMEAGKLQLTDPVAKYLPEFSALSVSVPAANGLGQRSYALAPAARGPTIQDLLRHTAGLAYGEITTNALVREAYIKGRLYKPEFDYNVTDLAPAEFVRNLAAAPLAYQPGTVWEYSLAVDLLGRVVEKISGERLGDFLAERLFQPLGMADSGFSVPAEKGDRIAEPLARDPASGAPIHLIDVRKPPAEDSAGAGGVGTAQDYLRFAEMLVEGGRLDEQVILSPTTLALMTSDQLGPSIRPIISPGEMLLGVPGYSFGLGFMVRMVPGLAGVPGSVGEFMWAGYAGTFFWVDPAEQLAVVMMMQAPGPNRAWYRREIKDLVYQAIIE